MMNITSENSNISVNSLNTTSTTTTPLSTTTINEELQQHRLEYSTQVLKEQLDEIISRVVTKDNAKVSTNEQSLSIFLTISFIVVTYNHRLWNFLMYNYTSEKVDQKSCKNVESIYLDIKLKPLSILPNPVYICVLRSGSTIKDTYPLWPTQTSWTMPCYASICRQVPILLVSPLSPTTIQWTVLVDN